MGFCPNCASYVSPGTNVCSCGTTFGCSTEIEETKGPTEYGMQEEAKRKAANGYYKQAEKLMDDGRYLEAVEYLDMAYGISGSP